MARQGQVPSPRPHPNPPPAGEGARKLHIERLDLDLHGMSATLAEAAVAQLGPALARALARRTLRISPTPQLDAGRIQTAASSDAAALAACIAQRIAHTTTRG